jgi:RimJ/RimL family protein N-acetyltransferase
VEARTLHTADLPMIEAFLMRHADSSMNLRGNLRRDGLEHGSVHAGAFDERGELRAVVAHYNATGNVALQADDLRALEVALEHAVHSSAMPVRGFFGRRDLVEHARSALRMRDVPTRYDSDEGLYALDLDALRLPPLASDPDITLRPLDPAHVEVFVRWRIAYEIESVGANADEALERVARAKAQQAIAHGEPVLLTHRGEPVAMTEFNARLPDTCQVGGVFTPVELRSRGYARAAVGLSLAHARSRGVRRAILFTGEHDVPAIKAYRALGFERIGDFKIVLFKPAD